MEAGRGRRRDHQHHHHHHQQQQQQQEQRRRLLPGQHAEWIPVTYFKLPVSLAAAGGKGHRRKKGAGAGGAGVLVRVHPAHRPLARCGLRDFLTQGEFNRGPCAPAAGAQAAYGDAPQGLPRLDAMGSMEELQRSLVAHLSAVVQAPGGASGLRRASAAGVLVSGAMGSGKTSLLLALAREFGFARGAPGAAPAYSEFVRCSELVNEKTEVIRHRLLEAFRACLSRAPSLLLLDDLDQLMPVTDEQPSPANLRCLQLAESFVDLMSAASRHMRSSPVAVVATVKSPNSFCPLLQLGGVLATRFQILPPPPEGRKDILERLLARRGVAIDRSVDLRALSYETEGYVGLDLSQLTERLVHAAMVRMLEGGGGASDSDSAANGNGGGGAVDLSLATGEEADAAESDAWYDDRCSFEADEEYGEEDVADGRQTENRDLANSDLRNDKSSEIERRGRITVTGSDFKEALKDFTPASLQGLPLQKSTTTWEDVGGLDMVKETLKETLELPSRYSPLFATVPLKLRSGILLYGPPGCGKTLLAAAVAKECGLNFISIKGPELLNKYIGASEQAVRDAFSKAEAAKPSVLFFDEFEAICPARGADSTGVTDRVVNQMLCHLDGVEGRSEVYVLAASSRPDLIDPALLRPGRLDKSLYCGFPDKKERLGILKALSRKLELGEQTDLKYIAARTPNYSGADLKGLLNDAQLVVVHQSLEGAMEGPKKEPSKLPNGHLNGDHTGANHVASGAREALVIQQHHLLQALNQSSKSISEDDRLRYDKIYSKFIRSREDRSDQKFGEGELRTTFA